jgi:tRNA-binding protein
MIYILINILLQLKILEGYAIMATFNDFMNIDIRIGEIINAEVFEKARRPAYKLWVDFGEEIGIKKTSAQITECYKVEELVGRQVLGVVNFPPKQVADFISEVLVLGVYSEQGVVLIQPDQKVKKGDKLG